MKMMAVGVDAGCCGKEEDEEEEEEEEEEEDKDGPQAPSWRTASSSSTLLAIG
jgi:hypothetical protein